MTIILYVRTNMQHLRLFATIVTLCLVIAFVFSKDKKAKFWHGQKQLASHRSGHEFQQRVVQTFAAKARKYKLILGVPSQDTQTSLFDTLRSLFNGLKSPLSDYNIHFIVQLTPTTPDVAKVWNLMNNVKREFKSQFEAGFLTIILPDSALYRDLAHVQLKVGEFEDEVRWRSKQVLDFANIMHYSSARAEYYLHLEDDVSATTGYLDSIFKFLNEIEHDHWICLEFSTLGLMGKLIPTYETPYIAAYFLLNFDKAPADVLFQSYMDLQHPPCRLDGKKSPGPECLQELGFSRILNRPSLFKQTGAQSSRPGAQHEKLPDTNFPVRYEPFPWQDVPIYANPPAILSTSLKLHEGYSLEKAYRHVQHLVTNNPVKGDYIHFKFTPPVQLEEFFLRAWHSSHQGKLESSAYIEILPLFPDRVDLTPSMHFKYKRLEDGYIKVGRFNERALAEGPLGSQFGKIAEARINIYEDHKHLGVLREIFFKLLLVPTKTQACCEPMWRDPFEGGIPGAPDYSQ